jgi:hypothetical protein
MTYLSRPYSGAAGECHDPGTKSQKDKEAAAYARGILRVNLTKVQNPRIRAEIVAVIK